MALLLDATPQRDTSAPSHAGLLHAYAVASPQAGASQGGRGFPLGSDPGDAHGSASKRRAFDRLHGRIPQAGPCSTLRRSLLHASARRPLWLQPFGLSRLFAMTLSPSLTIFAILSSSGFASWAKIVTAPHADHDVRHSKNCRKARSSPAGFAPIQAGARRDRRAAAVRRRAAATPS
jgi:hypothetical protein